MGPTDLHGITATDAANAPVFAEVAGDVAERIDGAVVAGHNVRFDLNFLQSEYALAGRRLPALPAICTLNSSWNLLPGLFGRKLCDVVADPNTMSGKAKTASRYGTRVLAERAFWRAVGIQTE